MFRVPNNIVATHIITFIIIRCFVTGGRDKFVKIWDMNCFCLGVINALPKLSKFVGELPPWKFKVNEEKILEDEIAEVVGIFEDVGVEPIEVGSKMDKEVDKIQVREKTLSRFNWILRKIRIRLHKTFKKLVYILANVQIPIDGLRKK